MRPTTEKSDALTHRIKVIVLLFATVSGLYYAQTFLKPLCFAMLLAMLLLPMTKAMEKKNIHTFIASFFSILVVTVVLAGIGYLIWWQASELAQNTAHIERTLDEWMRQAQRFLYRTFGLDYQDQKEMLDEQQSALAGYIPSIMEEMASLLAKIILVLVYAYMFLTHRDKINRFILSISGSEDEEKTRSIIDSANQLSIGYLGGLLKLIVAMTILYSLGYWIIGIKNPIFFGSVCGAMEMIPFVGNLIGSLFATVGAIAQSGNTEVIPLIFLVYLVVQFIQSYILEPLILGSQVNVNPLFSILVLIVGELIWGVAGMVLAIPLLGILKIYFDHNEKLKPYGRLIGSDVGETESSFSKVKKWFKRKRKTD